ncbi:hypothetical protein [Kitasatospora sp. HPMI-4]|uniref:hypothetical protein n=1 Tax=Kitasatospora sp. HPMI-4 TaxID=3448443 RepID=UPI003F1A4257
MTSIDPQDAAQIRLVGKELRASLGILAEMAEQAGPEARLLILDQLWPWGQVLEAGVLPALADLLTAAVRGMGPEEAASAAYLEEASGCIEDTVGGERIERAQLLLAEMLSARADDRPTPQTPVGGEHDFEDLVTGPGDLV